MFPYVEKKRRVDEYGETVDVGMWLRKGKILEEDAERDATKEDIRLKQLEEDAKVCTRVPLYESATEIYRRQRINEEPPSKFVSSIVDIQLSCRLLFVDMEGLNDGRAVKTIVPQINPRKMVRQHSSLCAAVLSLYTKDYRSCVSGGYDGLD
jgi:cleavage and polyadenylation specificity factor subunit 2